MGQKVSPKKQFMSPGPLVENRIRGDSPHPYKKKIIKIGPNGQPIRSKIVKSDVSEAKVLFTCDLSDDEEYC